MRRSLTLLFCCALLTAPAVAKPKRAPARITKKQKKKESEFLSTVELRLGALIRAKAPAGKRALIELTIHPKGTLSAARVVKSSQSPAYDRAGIKAAMAAAPYPAPPKHLLIDDARYAKLTIALIGTKAKTLSAKPRR